MIQASSECRRWAWVPGKNSARRGPPELLAAPTARDAGSEPGNCDDKQGGEHSSDAVLLKHGADGGWTMHSGGQWQAGRDVAHVADSIESLELKSSAGQVCPGNAQFLRNSSQFVAHWAPSGHLRVAFTLV